MKIGITGHTKGFGKYLFDCLQKDHEIIGFSRSNSFDISIESSRANIIQHSADCDIFINNAHLNFHQTELLYQIFNQWRSKKKLIINIGSNARDFINMNKVYDYSVQKLALNNASKQLGRLDVCRVTTIDFGFLSRPTGNTIPYSEAIDYIQLAISAYTKNHRLLEILAAHE